MNVGQVTTQKKIVVYGLDVSVEPKKCAWVKINYEGKVKVGVPGVENLISSLNEHLDSTIYFGIEAPMWIPLIEDIRKKITRRFEEEENREWYRDSGAGASMKSLVLWEFIKSGLNRDLDLVDFRPFEGFATGCYKPNEEVYSSLINKLKEEGEINLSKDAIDAYIITHARWSDLFKCNKKIANIFYEKFVKDENNLKGRFRSLWDGVNSNNINSPMIFGYKFQWHIKEVLEDNNASISGDDLRVYLKSSEINISLKLEKKYKSLKFLISSKDLNKIKDIKISNGKLERIDKVISVDQGQSETDEETEIAYGSTELVESEYKIIFDGIEESTISILFNRTNSRSFISLRKPFLQKN